MSAQRNRSVKSSRSGPGDRLAELEPDAVRPRAAVDGAARDQRELADFFENAAVPLHWVGPDGTILRANRAELELLGYRPEEYIGRHIAEFHVDQPVIEDILRRLTAGEVLHDYPSRVRRKDGSVRDVVITSSVYRDDGRFMHTRCLTRDVTEQKQAADRLATQHAITRVLAESSDLREAAPKLIRAVCKTANWEIGAFWDAEHDKGRLRCVDLVNCSDKAFPRFEPATRGCTLSAGIGLPGRALSTAAPAWISDVTQDWNFPRASIAAQEGLHGAFALPIILAGRVLGVLEFFSSDVRPPDPALLQLLTGFGSQIGQFTERKRAEHSLRENERRLREMIDALPAAVYTTDADGRITHFNPAAVEFSGRVPELGTDQWCVSWKMFRPDGTPLPHDQCPMAVALKEGRIPHGVEAIAERPDGTRIWFVPYPTPLRDGEGRIVGGVNMLLDVTERRQAEEAMRHRTAQFETLVAEAPLGVYMVDDQFRIREVNATAAPFFGDIPDLIGRDFGEVARALWLEAHAEELVRRFRHTLETGEPYVAPESGGQRRDRGVTEYHEWQISRIPLPEGRVGVVCYVRDISAQVLARERLRQTTKMEAIGRLAGGLAHDFNNQLQALSGFADFVARDAGLSGRSRLDLAEVRKAGDRMASLTQQLLAFSRQQMLMPETLDLNEMVRDSHVLLQRLIGTNIEMRFVPAPEPVWVRADRGQLLQVLMNLTVNGRDAMPDGGEMLIELGEWQVDVGGPALPWSTPVPPGRYGALVVTDSGTGIPPDALPHLFEPFFTTKEVGKGTGLGLATVHGIVSQSQGYVWAENVAMGGARFTVLLPLTGEPVDIPSDGQERRRAPARPARLLVVEDEDAVRAMIVRTLEHDGYEVREARHGSEALDRVVALGGAVDLVICDVVMPVMGGREFGGRLAEAWPAVGVVWMSGYQRDDAFGDGAMREDGLFLQKPVSGEVLLDTVRRALESRKAAQA
ncbi:MAG TPA: PAS domain S-box protein [Gemmatimonadales bacterium]|nr:PAS domain S-box protein [Gemmatimonadales bacterium]